MLKLVDVQAHYGSIHVLKGITIEVPEGQIVTLLGANGAGKTTTLKCISGVIQPSGGTITLEGAPLNGQAVETIVAKGIVQSPEGRQIFATLTVEENLMAGAFTVSSKEKIEALKAQVYKWFPRLAERADQVAGTLSGGEQQMLAIGRALMADPKILILDEPSLGLAPLIVRDIFAIIKEIKATGKTILLVEQNARQALAVSDYAYVLETGLIVHEGVGHVLAQDERIKAAYLGGHIA